MRQEFLCDEQHPTKADAWDAAPWAAIIKKVTGAWVAFESMDEYKTWVSQK